MNQLIGINKKYSETHKGMSLFFTKVNKIVENANDWWHNEVCRVSKWNNIWETLCSWQFQHGDKILV